jgi:hypothetical protein
VDTAALLTEIIDVWGGARNIALDMKLNYESSPKGSVVRQRTMDTIQRLIIQNTASELSRPKNPEDLDEADLDQVILGYVNRVSSPDNPESEAPP